MNMEARGEGTRHGRDDEGDTRARVANPTKPDETDLRNDFNNEERFVNNQ